MAASYEADAATEALIAQLMAEDFGEAYVDHMRPIGSHAGDYEEPLTSYERQCLENPDMEDGEGGWNPPTPKIVPVESPTLPEGESWDSSINDDPRIESTPAMISAQNGESDDDDTDGGISFNGPSHHTQDTTENHSEPEELLHHIQDPVDYHKDAPTRSLTRHASVPVQELVSPIEDSRRVISDPSRLENITDTAEEDPPSPVIPEPAQSRPAEPISLSPNHLVPKSPKASDSPLLSNPFPPTVATNERLLNLINNTSKLNSDKSSFLNAPDDFSLGLGNFGHFDSSIDTSSLKNKGKAPATDTATDPNDRMRNFMDKYNKTFFKRDKGIDCSSAKSKGKAREGSDSLDQLDDGVHGEESFDERSGMLFLRVPWPDSGRRDRELREAMDAQVHEIWVGEEETVESILLDIREREEIRERPWGSWGVDDVGGGDDLGIGNGKGKGKGESCGVLIEGDDCLLMVTRAPC